MVTIKRISLEREKKELSADNKTLIYRTFFQVRKTSNIFPKTFASFIMSLILNEISKESKSLTIFNEESANYSTESLVKKPSYYSLKMSQIGCAKQSLTYILIYGIII